MTPGSAWSPELSAMYRAGTITQQRQWLAYGLELRQCLNPHALTPPVCPVKAKLWALEILARSTNFNRGIVRDPI